MVRQQKDGTRSDILFGLRRVQAETIEAADSSRTDRVDVVQVVTRPRVTRVVVHTALRSFEMHPWSFTMFSMLSHMFACSFRSTVPPFFWTLI